MITRMLLHKFVSQALRSTHDMATLPQLIEEDIHQLDEYSASC